MKQITMLTLLVPALVLCLCVMPAAGVIQEVTVKGTVSALSQEKNTLTVSGPLRYGCSYPASGAPVCTFNAMTETSLTGTVPSDSAFAVLKPGDTVVATSMGGAGETWISIAKLYGPATSQEYVTDLFGEPSTIPVPYAGNYALDMTNIPDCTTCFGTTCTALTSTVHVLSGDTRVLVKTLEPRQALTYNGRNDGSSITVTFVNGEASSEACAGGYGMTGPQPVSVYIVNVVPPVGFAPQAPATPAPVAPPATAVPTTAKSGSLPLAVTGALGAVALLLAVRRQ